MYELFFMVDVFKMNGTLEKELGGTDTTNISEPKEFFSRGLLFRVSHKYLCNFSFKTLGGGEGRGNWGWESGHLKQNRSFITTIL